MIYCILMISLIIIATILIVAIKKDVINGKIKWPVLKSKKTHIITLWYNVSDQTYIGGNNMCQIDYNTNKKEKKYTHLNYTERTQIERWYNIEHKSKTE